METKNKQKQEKLTRKQRIEQLKLQIRELGFWNLPSQRVLAEKFNVSQVMINKDLKKIISKFDPKELDEVFTSFYETDKKIARELSKMLYQGDDEQKLKAAQVMLQLQKSFTELLESWNKKKKVAEQLEIKQAQITTEEQRIYEKYYGDKNGEERDTKSSN